MNIKNIGNYTSIEQVSSQYLNTNRVNDVKTNEISFKEVLLQKKNSLEEIPFNSTLKFSKHAGERLADRNIDLTDEQLKRLEDGVKKASEKGIKESLVIMDNFSFIVNTKNNIVITAMDQAMEGENVYTNIDGAVVI